MNPMALVEQLRTWGQDPNVRHFLDVVIPGAEGTTEHGYNTAFGGGRFESLADHPRYLKPFKQTDGKTNYTSAAGKYQFLSNTWDETAKALGLTDFGPESQDLGALYLLHQKGVLPYLKAGDFKTAVDRTGSVWASLPSSNYPQPKRDAGFIEGLVNRMVPTAQAGVLPPELRTQRPVVDPAVLNEYNKVYGEDAGFIPAVIGIDNWKRALQARFDATGEDMGGNFDEFTKYMTPDEVSRLNAYLGKGSSTQSQRNTAMNTTQQPQSALPNARGLYNPEDPLSVYNFITSNQQNVPVQQLTPEQKEMLLADRRQRAGMLPLALAASLAGDRRVSGLGGALAEDAMKARGPQRLGNAGWLTEDGTVIKDPFQEEESQQRRQDVALNLAMQTANTQALRRLSTENTFSQAGRTPDGKPVVSNRTGQHYTIEQGPNGVSYAPYNNTVIPAATYDKNVQTAQDALGSVKRFDELIEDVKKNPAAFGFLSQFVSNLPSIVQGRASSLLLPEDAIAAKTNIMRVAAKEINELYGAALSLGEQARANTFIPNANDDEKQVVQKLQSAREWAESITKRYGPGALNDARARSGMPQAPVQPGSGAKPAAGGEIRKTINGKNYVYRDRWYEE